LLYRHQSKRIGRGALYVDAPRRTDFAVRVEAMSQSEIFDPARLVLHPPPCPKCGSSMWLAQIEPDEPDHDKRIFECPQCEHVFSETVKYR
jgi:hypothetical protein